MQVLKDNIFKITPNLDLKRLDLLKERIEEQFKNYQEPEFDQNGRFIPKRKNLQKQINENNIDQVDIDVMEDQAMMDDLRKEMSLPEDTLVTNLFIHTAVICSKVDLVQQGEKGVRDVLEQNIDYI